METIHFIRQVIRIAALAMGCFCLSGCGLYSHSLDGNAAIKRDQILGRTFVLNADAHFPRAKTHFLFEFRETFPYYDKLPLTRGTILQVKHIESIDLEGIYECTVNQVQAIIQTGPYKGERVSVGTMWGGSDPAAFWAYDGNGGLDEDSGKALVPLPANPPPWLQSDVIPPQAKSVDMNTLRQALQDPDGIIRYYALRAMVLRAPLDPQTIQSCVTALRDAVSQVSAFAVETLRQNGPATNLNIDALAHDLINNPDPAARSTAASILGLLGDSTIRAGNMNAKESIRAALAKAKTDPDENVRTSVSQALDRIKD